MISSPLMKTKPRTPRASKNGRDTVLCKWKGDITVSQVEDWLKSDNMESRAKIVDFIYHRLHNRYLRPLEKLACEYKSGFLTMAACCLLIETLYSFHKGKADTKRMSEHAFKTFFKEDAAFHDFTDPSVMFFQNIRCGILHQAQTQGGYCIVRDASPLLDIENRTINANTFMAALKDSLDRYKQNLLNPKFDPKLWKHAKKKVRHICDECKWE